MTVPYFPQGQGYGIDSDIAQREWNEFLRRREGYTQQLRAQQEFFQSLQTGRMPVQPGVTPAMVQPQTLAMDDTELLGQARYWGIPNEVASQMPADELQQLIAQMRQENRPAEAMAPGFDLAAMFVLGAGEGITGGLKRLPLVGDAFARAEWLREADEWLNHSEEAVRATMPQQAQMLASAVEITGQVASMWFPAMGAWKLAGVAGKIIPARGVLGAPILRQAAQGAGSGWLLEGGSEHPYWAMGIGGGLGALTPPALAALQKYGPIIAAMNKRVSQSFGGLPERFIRAAELPGTMPVDQAQAFARPARGPRTVIDELDDVINNPNSASEARESALALREQLAPTLGPPPPPAGSGGGSIVTPTTSTGTAVADSWRPATSAREWWDRLSPEDRVGLSSVHDELVGMDPLQNFDELNVFAQQKAINFFDYIQSSNAAATQPMDIRPNILGMFMEGSEPLSTGIEMAENAAAQMSKQSMAAASSSLPEMARAAAPNEASITIANLIDNPGGINITPGIADPAGFTAAMEGVPYTRFAMRGNRLDALVSDQPITDEIVSQYEAFGVYNGQAAKTIGGRAVRVVEAGPETSVVEPIYGGSKQLVSTSHLSPSPITPGADSKTLKFQQFAEYVDEQLNATAEAMGQALTPELMTSIRTSNLQNWINTFLDEKGIVNPGNRARIEQFFNEQYVQMFRQAAPETAAMQEAAAQQASIAAMIEPPTPITGLRELAETQGYSVIPDGAGGWRVTDNVPPMGVSPVQMSFGSREAAEAWLRNIHRPAPDITPASEIPMEVAEALPRVTGGAPSLRNDRLPAVVMNNLDDVAESAAADGDEALAGSIRAMVEEAKKTGKIKDLYQAWDYGLGKFQPMRNRMLAMERFLGERGNNELRPFAHWDAASTGIDKSHNFGNPHLERWSTITEAFDAKQLNTGLVVETWAIQDPAARLAAAQKAGFTKAQIAALDEMDTFFPEVLDDLARFTGRTPNVSSSALQEIKQLLVDVRVRQFADLDISKIQALSPATKPMLEQLQRAHVDLREFDARLLGNLFVRSHGYNEFVKTPMEQLRSVYREVAKIKETSGLADVMLNWANMVEHGYLPGTDIALETLHSLTSFFVPGVTKTQVRNLFNGGLSVTHSALLGFRPDIMVRDSLQLFLALPRAGTDLIRVMGKYAAGDSAYHTELWDRAIRHGWGQLGKPKIAQPGVFEDPLLFSETEQALVSQPAVSKRYELVQDVGNFIHDWTPKPLKDFVTKYPLYFYTKQQERMRALVGEAGYQRADRAIKAFREAGAKGDLEKLVLESGAGSYEPAVGKRFKDIMASGNDEEAAAFLGRQLADATQFRYGSANTPEIARTLFGKMGMQLGSFTPQFYQYMKESIRYGSAAEKVGFLTMMGGVGYALNAAQNATGWNFNKWQFLGSGMFTGGPWFQTLSDMATGVAAVNQMAVREMGPEQSGGEYLVRDANRLGGVARDVVNMFNPARGLVQTAANISAGTQSPTPTEGVLRAILTGERSASMDWQEHIRGALLQQPPIDALQQTSTPLRASIAAMPPVPLGRAPMTGPDGFPIQQSTGPASLSIGSTLDPQALRQLGVTDPTRVQQSNGAWTYESTRVGRDGRPGTHRLDQAPKLLRPGQTWEEYEEEVERRQDWSDTNVVNAIGLLDPEMQPRVQALQAMAQQAGMRLDVRETARPQPRQEYLWQQGRGRPGPIVTWTLTSSHASGRGVDFLVNGDVSGRDPGYQWLWKAASQVGLVPLGAIDPGHIAGTDSSFSAVPLSNLQARPDTAGGGFF